MTVSSGPVASAATTPLPSGTVSFVFTDIEGSTQRWERDRAAMEAAVRRHDALVRAAVAQHTGHVFKTVGDAFCTSFHRPQDAVAAAAAIQAALANEDFRAVDGIAVRIAIHTGTADEREGDYFGPAVNRVARILAVGYGGQILISGVTADIAIASLPRETTLKDLGQHRLRDLERPEQIYQLVQRDLRADFPALRSLDRLPNNLPASLTSFVGRDGEVDEIAMLLGEHRIVTLVGSGGVGKTRTSLQVAANLLDGSGDGVWFVEFAQVADAALIPATIAATIGIVLPPGDHLAALTAALAGMRTLLVLDNCEHLIDATAATAAAIVARCPAVRILASSRQPLGISGELPYRLPSLGVPADADAPDAGRAVQFSAIALFVERARIVDRQFGLTDANVALVVDICRRLDGIALAIELAAARIAVLSLQQLRNRLNERFRLLTGTNRTALPRQQTLRALIDWSYDLLSEQEKTLFDRFGIFSGSCTLEAMTEICSGDGLDEDDAFDVLVSLVDKSLIGTEASDHTSRYRMLESVRVYAAERLEKRGERRALVTRHLHFYCKKARETVDTFEASGREAAYEPILDELENVRAAVDRALEPGGDVVTGADLVSLVPWELRSWAERHVRLNAFSSCDLSAHPAIAARLWMLLGVSRMGHGEDAAGREAAERALSAARQSGDAVTVAHALLSWGTRAQETGEAALREAQALVGEHPSARLRIRLLSSRAFRLLVGGEFDEAAVLFDELLTLQRSLGNERMATVTLHNFAEAEDGRGNHERAAALARENIAILERLRDYTHAARMIANLAGFLTGAERFDELRELMTQAEQYAAHFGEFFTALLASHMAAAHAARGDLTRAAVLRAFSETTFARLRYGREYNDQRSSARSEIALRGMEPAERAKLEERGAFMTYADAFKLAVSYD